MIINENKITLKQIQDAKYSSSFMDEDRAEIKIDNKLFIKIGKNKWQYNPMQNNVIGGEYTDKYIFDLVNSSKTSKLLESSKADYENLDSELITLLTKLRTEANDAILKYYNTGDLDETKSILNYLCKDSKSTLKYINSISGRDC